MVVMPPDAAAAVPDSKSSTAVTSPTCCVQVRMDIHATGEYLQPTRVDSLSSIWQVRRDGDDPTIGDAHIGHNAVCRRDDHAASYDKLTFHGQSSSLYPTSQSGLRTKCPTDRQVVWYLRTLVSARQCGQYCQCRQ